jgi:hypothetical protein
LGWPRAEPDRLWGLVGSRSVLSLVWASRVSGPTATVSRMQDQDKVGTSDAVLRELLASVAEHTHDPAKKAFVLDFLLTMEPLAEWPEPALDALTQNLRLRHQPGPNEARTRTDQRPRLAASLPRPIARSPITEFYRALGFTLCDADEPGRQHMVDGLIGRDAGLQFFPAGNAPVTRVQLGFRVADLATVRTELDRLGMGYELPMARRLRTTDPDGNRVHISEVARE